MSGNKVYDSDDHRHCGAKTRSGGSCRRPAGWGTDHAGSGRCKLHGGKSTGAKTAEGKAAVAKNAIKHGAYIERLITVEEQELHDWLFEETIQKYDLDRGNPIHMTTLSRACITYIKLIRLDQWELEEEFEPNELEKDPKTGDEEPKLRPMYDRDGNVVGAAHGKLRRLRHAKGAPAWETHFQKYIVMLGVDRATEQRLKAEGDNAAKVVDAFGWLWGKQQDQS